MYLLPRELLDAALGAAFVTVDYLPDAEGIGLWVNDLEIGAHGRDVAEARAHLLREVRAYVTNFLGQLSVYLTWPDRARLVPQILRLAVAQDEEELARLLFGPAGRSVPATADVGPVAPLLRAPGVPAVNDGSRLLRQGAGRREHGGGRRSRSASPRRRPCRPRCGRASGGGSCVCGPRTSSGAGSRRAGSLRYPASRGAGAAVAGLPRAAPARGSPLAGGRDRRLLARRSAAAAQRVVQPRSREAMSAGEGAASGAGYGLAVGS